MHTTQHIRSLAAGWMMISILISSSGAVAEDRTSSRRFSFTYAATVQGLEPGEAARIWIPLPPENAEQQAAILSKSLPVWDVRFGRDEQYGNQFLYFAAPADASGHIHFSITYRVTRRAASEEAVGEPGMEMADLDLGPDKLVPVGGKAMSLIQGKTLPTDQMQLGRALFDIVDQHMQYRKDKPGWGRGDSDWACQSGFGNCTDFHSLFLSLARANHLPAKFEIGFSIPSTEGGGAGASRMVSGYHCWAWFKPAGHGWVPVDISEANKHPQKRDYYFGHLDADRVAFTTGRDLILDPKQDGPPLNFFVFPYVEVHGAPYPQQNVITHCTYEDVEQSHAAAQPKP